MVQESEGTVIIVVPDPAEVQDLTTGEVALQYCPQGVWVCFDDCKVAPLAGKLESKIDPSAREALWRLIALHPSSTKGPADCGAMCPAIIHIVNCPLAKVISIVINIRVCVALFWD